MPGSERPIDLTLERYRSIDRKVSRLIDRLDELTGLASSLDSHIATLEKDRYRHELQLAEMRSEIDLLQRRLELRGNATGGRDD